MKRLTPPFGTLIVLCVSMLATACSLGSPSGSLAYLSLTVGPAAKSITATTLATVDHYEATLTSAASEIVLTDVLAQPLISLAEGDWAITVSAFDAPSGGKVVGMGSASTTVVAGTNNLSVQVLPVMTSSGKLHVQFGWAPPSVDRVVFSISPWSPPAPGTTPVPDEATATATAATSPGTMADYPSVSPFLTKGTFTFSPTSQTATFEADVKSGTYLLTLVPMATKVPFGIYSEIVQVFDGAVSSGSVNPVWAIHYHANGGTGTKADTFVEEDRTTFIPSNPYTWSAHFFTGWNTQADGNGKAYVPGSYTDPVTDNVTLYAQWTDAFTVRFTQIGNTNNGWQTAGQGGSSSFPSFVLYFIGIYQDTSGYFQVLDTGGSPAAGATGSDLANQTQFRVSSLSGSNLFKIKRFKVYNAGTGENLNVRAWTTDPSWTTPGSGEGVQQTVVANPGWTTIDLTGFTAGYETVTIEFPLGSSLYFNDFEVY